VRPALAAWWRPRLHRIADWVVATEAARPRAKHVAAEVKGLWELPGVTFTLSGRADRIETHPGGLVILDYKTGTAPAGKEVTKGTAPQLPLEAAMARAGAFGPDVQGATAELIYWKLTGGLIAGESTSCPDPDGAVATAAEQGLLRLVKAYAEPVQAYRAQPQGKPPRYPQYSQLARVGEWSAPDEAVDE